MKKSMSIFDLFAVQYQSHPNKVAICDVKQHLTYQDIYQLICQISFCLNKSNSSKNISIGVCLNETIYLPVVLLSIIAMGHVYVPIDKDDPKDVIEDKLKSANVKILITDNNFILNLNSQNVTIISLASILNGQHGEYPFTSPDFLQPVYTMFTSGSTGKAKGVVMPQRGLLNRLNWMWETFPFVSTDVMCQKTSPVFVDSLWEILGGLLKGITTYYVNHDELLDLHALLISLKNNSISWLTATPSYINTLMEEDNFHSEELPKLKTFILSGEPLLTSLAAKLKQKFPFSKILNLYGSTEVAGDVAAYEFTGNETDEISIVPLGLPVSNTRIYVLNSQYGLVDQDEIGEIFVAGDNLALGYSDPEETALRFISNVNFLNEKVIYKTGDLGKKDVNGLLHYEGRNDRQIKHKGIRINIANIENALLKRDDISQVAVLLQDDSLIAYYKAKKNIIIDQEVMRKHALNNLNVKTLPDVFIQLMRFPQTTTGKIDYKALLNADQRPKPNFKEKLLEDTLELKVLAIFENILNVDIKLADNLFDAGLNSLLAIRVLSKIRKLNIEISIHDIFNNPTIASLLQSLSQKEKASFVV